MHHFSDNICCFSIENHFFSVDTHLTFRDVGTQMVKAVAKLIMVDGSVAVSVKATELALERDAGGVEDVPELGLELHEEAAGALLRGGLGASCCGLADRQARLTLRSEQQAARLIAARSTQQDLSIAGMYIRSKIARTWMALRCSLPWSPAAAWASWRIFISGIIGGGGGPAFSYHLH